MPPAVRIAMPAAAMRMAPPNARSPGVAVASWVPIAPATARKPIIPASITASPASASGPAAASWVAASAIMDIPADAIRTRPAERQESLGTCLEFWPD